MTEQIWFTADTHFFHKSIVDIGRGRPWDTSDEMNEALVENWNSVVAAQDRVYHLGDVSFGNKNKTIEVLSRLNGQIHIIRGNHDHSVDQAVKACPELVVSYQPYKEIKVADQRLVLFHFPILSWHQMHKGSWHLHGHCHGNLTFDNGPMMDVGVDVQGYRPIEFEEVAEQLAGREVKAYDHHTPRLA